MGSMRDDFKANIKQRQFGLTGGLFGKQFGLSRRLFGKDSLA